MKTKPGTGISLLLKRTIWCLMGDSILGTHVTLTRRKPDRQTDIQLVRSFSTTDSVRLSMSLGCMLLDCSIKSLVSTSRMLVRYTSLVCRAMVKKDANRHLWKHTAPINWPPGGPGWEARWARDAVSLGVFWFFFFQRVFSGGCLDSDHFCPQVMKPHTNIPMRAFLFSALTLQ